MLKILERELPKLWTDELYSEEFKARTTPYKDFDHAVKHILKAAAMLQSMTEHADHWGAARLNIEEAIRDARKYLADVVISAVRAALVHPSGPIDLEDAIRVRIREKMKAELPADLVLVPKSLLIQAAHEIGRVPDGVDHAREQDQVERELLEAGRMKKE